jgi:hypothetical protein
LIPMQKFPHFQILCSKGNLCSIWHTEDKTRKEMLNLGVCVCVQNFHQFFWANNLLGKELQLPTSRASHYGHMTLLITKEPGIEDGGCVQPAAAPYPSTHQRPERFCSQVFIILTTLPTLLSVRFASHVWTIIGVFINPNPKHNHMCEE